MPPSPPLSPFPWFDVAIILLLVVLNGVFAMSEIVTASIPRLLNNSVAEARIRPRVSSAAPDRSAEE